MRSRGGPTRRSAGGIGLAMAAVAVLLAAGPVAGQEHPPEGLLPPGEWTEEQVDFLLDLIDRTEAALPAFADATTLEGLGFYEFGIAAPGGYDHWINPGWIDDGRLLDPEHPESLVFQHTADGGYELQAAMYMLDSNHTMDTIPEDIAWLPGWHIHDELCVDDDGRFVGLVDGNGACFSGHVADFPPMMHVWIVDNPCGHRFGGLGVTGLHCDVSHGHPPGTTPPSTDPPGQDPPPSNGNGNGNGANDGMPPPAPPAQPVAARPSFTG